MVNPISSEYSIKEIRLNNSIEYINYSSSRKLCIIPVYFYKLNLKEILPLFFSEFSKDTILWTCMDIKDKKAQKEFAKNGFNSPYLCMQIPGGNKIPKCIAMSRENTPTEEYNYNHTLLKIQDILNFSEDSKACFLQAVFSPKAVSFLKQTAKMKSTKEKQTELGGELEVIGIHKNKNDIIYVIGVNEKSINSGSEEDIEIAPTRFNFHSHPEQAYIRHSVHKAWPSLTDYLGYLSLGVNTIFHAVATLEGIYVMSFGPYWCNNVKKIPENFVKENYKIDRKENYSPKEYSKIVSNIKLNNEPVFIVHFLRWSECTKPFEVHYAKIRGSCIPTEKGMKKYKKIHK